MSIQKLKFDRKFAHIALGRPFNVGVEYPNRSKTITIALSLSTDIAAVIATAPFDIIPMGLIEPIKRSGYANYPHFYGY
jgi:hypothetical protein